MQQLVVPLDEVRRGDIARVGGKGANLGDMLAAGFPVPPGFVVTTAAYDLVADALVLDGLDAAATRKALVDAEIPPELERAIAAAYYQLGAGPVAVRSSATAEDLPEAAFAGQQDSFLNVVGVRALLEAVRKCWASLWTDRAVDYRSAHGFGQRGLKLAVVVQRMVDAEAAGVLFTANPVTGARGEVVIDANPGLGEAVVSGLVTPDHYVLRPSRLGSRLGWRIVQRQPGRREVVVRPVPGGGTEHVDGATAGDAALSRRQLRRLAAAGAAIEEHFGGPQDVEWACAGGRVFVVQSRPITALPALPPAGGRMPQFMAGLLAEMLPIRPYPFDMTTWTGTLFGAVEGAFRFAGIAYPPVDRVFVEEDGVLVRITPIPPKPTPRLLLTPLRMARRARHYDPSRWEQDPLLVELEARVETLRRRDLPALSWPQLLAALDEALTVPVDVFELRLHYLPRAALHLVRLRLLLLAMRRGELIRSLLSSPENKTTQINRELAALAADIRSDPRLNAVFADHEPAELLAVLRAGQEYQPFVRRFEELLARYGHRETTSPLLASQPTWSDAPEVVLGLLKGAAAAPPPPRGQPAAVAAREALLAHPLARLRPVRAALLAAMEQVPRLIQVREDTRFYATLPLPIIRHIALELGRRLVEVGALDKPDDVLHLRLPELRRVGETWPPAASLVEQLRGTARRRAAKRESLAGTPLVDPRWLHRDTGGDALLRGTPGSPGVAEGPARIILDASAFSRLRPGDVLVAPYTQPAWTPLFRLACAVVVDSGGPASHAAIVAREYGIPAVLATGTGTTRLTDGQRIRVDGDRGVVTLPSG